MSAQPDIASRDRAVLFHPDLPNATTDRVVIVSGEGSRVQDTQGRRYLDMHGGAWLSQVGHGRPELAEIAADQITRVEHFPTRGEYSNEPAVALAEWLIEVAPPGLAKVQYSSTGSEGVELALKMARYYHHQRGEPDRTVLLSLRGAYHGYGTGGSALGIDREGFGPGMPDVIRLTPPWPYHPELHDGQDPTDYCLAELERTISEVGGRRIAALFGEPAMAVAGMVVLPDDYWPRVAKVLQAHGILLVLDEVVTAFGRVGHWFGADHYGVEPDIVVTAKGIASGYMPLGAVIISEPIAEALGSGDGFPVASSYGGHPVACAVGLGSLRIIERERLLERSNATGAHLLRRLEALRELPIVGDVRGLGLMLGIELVADQDARTPVPAATDLARVIRDETGVLVSIIGSTVALTPPLVLTIPEADEAVAALQTVLPRLQPDGTLHRSATHPLGVR